jgi:type I restriction enzyme S subunit
MSFDLPVLPQGWSYVPLEQLAQKNSVTYGVVQPGSHVGHGIPIVRVNNFKDGHIELSELMRIEPEIETKYGRTRLQGGEVLLTLVGSVGQVAVVPEALKGFNVARAVAVIHPKEVDPNWLAICLRSPLSQHLLSSRANTTVQTTINLKELRALPVPLAPQYEREKIIELIGSLDDRITLLRRTNATMEAIAQAMFKSWFVNFDPVRAKAEGLEPEGMDAETAALFPDSLQESVLGLVPKGWNVGKVEDLLELPYGKALKATDRTNGPIPVYGSGGITGYHNVSLVNGPSVIVGRKGTVGSLYWEDRPFFPIDTVFYVRTDNPLSYCYYLLRTLGLEGMNTDGAVPGLNRNNAYRLPVVVAPRSILESFDGLVASLRNKIYSNDQHLQTLAQLRDTLLPRLISGQLRLPEYEQVARATCA